MSHKISNFKGLRSTYHSFSDMILVMFPVNRITHTVIRKVILIRILSINHLAPDISLFKVDVALEEHPGDFLKIFSII